MSLVRILGSRKRPFSGMTPLAIGVTCGYRFDGIANSKLLRVEGTY